MTSKLLRQDTRVLQKNDYSVQQREQFKARLVGQMLSLSMRPSPTLLAREFNLRWRGASISTNTARRWLHAESIPTRDKLLVLANLLNASEDWLRWGGSNTFVPVTIDGLPAILTNNEQSAQEITASLTQDMLLLSVHDREILRAILNTLLKLARKTKPKVSMGSDGELEEQKESML